MSQSEATKYVVTVPAVISHLIPKYLDICRRDVSSLEALLREGEFKELQRRGHNLKGSGAAYGFVEASRLGGLLEEAARAQDSAAVTSLSEELVHYFASVEVHTA